MRAGIQGESVWARRREGDNEKETEKDGTEQKVGMYKECMSWCVIYVYGMLFGANR